MATSLEGSLDKHKPIESTSQATTDVFQSGPSRWRALTNRDAAAHCSFLYGVLTTKVYCRPTCTARLARRANVIYFDTADQAQREGFRPCTRCKPDELGFIGQREEVVLRTLGLLLRDETGHVAMERGVKALSKEVGVTPSYLCRVFKAVMGCTLGQYCRVFDEAVISEDAEKISLSPSGSTESEAVHYPQQSFLVSEALTPEMPKALEDTTSWGSWNDFDEAFVIGFDFEW
ncbi:hypothetical protein TI39_contig481g00027 [Zymoseptoria brevis]|uniref:Ada DNA repair metal-binding domain-containing protein n=1 Tax=Zymoseptoria brevis TaxID=1047168 RepID=A0A0F4GMY1_9PEZI|nr:hypothetical protein TI39_contig481g00027 [Zymoseptoria brevis]